MIWYAYVYLDETYDDMMYSRVYLDETYDDMIMSRRDYMMIWLCLVEMYDVFSCVSRRDYMRLMCILASSRRDFMRDCEVLWRSSWLFRVLVVGCGVKSQDPDTFI